MSKRDKRKPQTAALAQGMEIDSILAQLSSLKDNARDSMTGSEDIDEIWKKDITACEAATAILSALQDEGIRDPEQVRDLIHDYHALAEQYQKMHQKYEVGAKAERLGHKLICPDCHREISRPGTPHCWFCGKQLEWRR